MCDVTYFMVFSLPATLRRQAENDLLGIYHDLLLQQGAREYSFEQCWDDYIRAFFINLDLLVVLVDMHDLSRPYGIKLVNSILPRLTAFIEDHPVANYL